MTKEERKAYDAAYYTVHREEKLAYDAEYRATHVEEKKAYRVANAEELMAYHAEHHAVNADKRNANARARRATNPEKVREVDLKTKYGMSLGAYKLMILMQRNACVICQEVFSKEPHVDHDHKTGEIRGLLCPRCNKGLGHFRDSIEFLDRAKEYLQGKI